MKKKYLFAIFLVAFLLCLKIGSMIYPNYTISLKNSPIEILSANLSKTDVKPGDILTVKVEAKSDFGIKEIIADMGGIENISLQHIAGNIYQGTWQNNWLVHSTKEKAYTVTLFVRDNGGNELSDKSLEFSDPSFGVTNMGSTSYPTKNYGDTSIETGTASIVTNVVQAADKITVSNPITIQNFSLYFQAIYNHNLKFAVYPDSSGTPVGQTLVKQTGGYNVSGTGWVTVNLSTADYIYLPAGTYWLCFLGDTTAGTIRRAGTTTDYYASQTYSSGYPATFPAATSETQGQYSFYVTSVQIDGYAKATKATLSDNNAGIQNMSFYSHATGNFRLAIYNDSSGPSGKLWESSDTAATASSWNNVTIASGTPTSLILQSGTYWLAWQWNSTNSGPSYTAGSSGDGNNITQNYGTFPASWSGGTSSSEKWSIYVSYSTPPNIQLNSPANNFNSSNAQQTFNFTATDNYATSMNCNLTVDGSVVNSSTATNATPKTFVNTLSEGTHQWNVSCADSSNNLNTSETRTITVDTTKPIITLNAPVNNTNTTKNWVLFNFTATDNLASTLSCTLYINNSANATNSSTANNTATTFNVTGIAEGFYQWNVTCLDNALNSNTSSTRSFTIDSSAPVTNSITLSPSSADDIDPNVRINITTNITDGGIGVDTVIFRYRCAAGAGTCIPGTDSWTNDTMDYNSGTGLYENASFTPDVSGTWQYKIWSNDTLGNANETSEQNLSVEYDYTWTRSPASFGVVSGIITKTVDVGILTINNTGDYMLNFDLSSDWANTFYNVTEPFDLAAKSVKIINTTATFSDTSREDLITITIDATTANADPSYSTTNATLASYAGGPYFDASIVTYSAAVSQSQSNITLKAKLKNIGNETSTNTWLNWTLPTGWTNTSGNLTQNIGNLAAGSTAWNNLTITIDATTASATTVAIGVNASSSENVIDSDSKSVIVSCNSTDGVCGVGCTASDDIDCQVTTTTLPSTSGGGGGVSTATLIEKVLAGKEISNSSETFELVRGYNNSFPVTVKNIFERTTLENVSVRIEGFLSQYMTISPKIIDKIAFNEVKQFNVTITSPEYMEKGSHNLTIIIIGKIIGTGIRKNLTETINVNLVIHTVSEEVANASLEQAISYVSEMTKAGFPTAKTSKLLEQAKEALAEHEYDDVKDLTEKIKESKENAFEAHDIIQEIKNKIGTYESITGIDRLKITGALSLPTRFTETEDMINLAQAAFERGDFDTALQRAKDANMTLALEKGEFNLIFFLMDYWWAIIISICALSASGFFGYQAYMKATISQRIVNLEREEDSIRELMEETQKKHFKEKTIGAATFYKTISQYQKRLSKIRQLRVKLRHKRVRLLKPHEVIKDLEEERRDVLKLLKNLQKDYFVNKKVSKAMYDEQAKVYNESLSELEDEQLTLETKIYRGSEK